MIVQENLQMLQPNYLKLFSKYFRKRLVVSLVVLQAVNQWVQGLIPVNDRDTHELDLCPTALSSFATSALH